MKELDDVPLEFLDVPPFPASHLVMELLEHPEDEFCKTMADAHHRQRQRPCQHSGDLICRCASSLAARPSR
jgi:hypothetical protein